jgi:hypothetical protein
VIDDKLLQKLDAVLGAAAAAAASVSESDAFDMVVLAGDVLMTHFDALSSRLGGDAPQLASPTTSNTSPLATSELRANISLAAAGTII